MRLRLEHADLARVRFTTVLNPFSETLISAQTLLSPQRPPALARFHERHDPAAPPMRVLRHLLPPTGGIPDFLTPGAGTPTLAEAVDGVRATPARVITSDTVTAYAGLTATAPRRSLAAADPRTVDALVRSAQWYFRRVLAPDWPALERQVRDHITDCGRRIAAGGVESVLGRLHPGIRWRSPVLSIDAYGDREIGLGGRGLTLAPWPLAGPRPRLLLAGDQPALVMYAIPLPGGWGEAGGQALAALLGRTRATVLRRLAVTGPYSTTEIADRLGISVASASGHTTALRAAGLIATTRAGRAVLHRITALGLDLVGAEGG